MTTLAHLTTTPSGPPRPRGPRPVRSRLAAAVAAAGALVAGLLLAPGAQAATDVPAAPLPAAVTAAAQGIGAPVLLPGQTLGPGEQRTSADGRDVLVMQTDGNLVLYSQGRARWWTGTMEPGSRFVHQSDNNLVVYSPGNRVLWSALTYLLPSAGLYLTHGELALINGEHLWTTRTGYERLGTGSTLGPGEMLVEGPFIGGTPARLVMQTDGNLVQYVGPSSTVYWHTRTHGNPGARAVMQGDGNLVVYSASGRPLWWSGTRGAGLSLAVAPYTRGYWAATPNRVLYQPGAVVILDPGDRPVTGYPNPEGYYAWSPAGTRP